jgi:hypothetical protein
MPQTSVEKPPRDNSNPLANNLPPTISEAESIAPSSTIGDVETAETDASDDPYSLRRYKRDDIQSSATQQVTPHRGRRRQRKIKKYYNRQNALIDAYLGSNEEEQLEVADTIQNGGKVRFAINASFICNFCLFVIQLYAAVSTGSLSLFATAADAFVSFLSHHAGDSSADNVQMDLVSSIVMMVTSRLAAKPNIRKFPVVSLLPSSDGRRLVFIIARVASVLRLLELFFSVP